jgi:hypothetical protein
MMKRTVFIFLICLFLTGGGAFGADNPILKLRDDTLTFFKPVTGSITSVDGKNVTITIAEKISLRPGTRLNILKEGELVRHPVTKEPLGVIESLSGKIEIRNSEDGKASGVIVSGEGKEGDKVRISDTKVRILFIQDKKMDWYVADEYYRSLKESGKFVMLDSALETDDETKVMAEARRLGAEAAVLLSSREAEKGTLIRQQLFWVADGNRFFEQEVRIETVFSKELRFGEEFFSPGSGEAMLMYDLPYNARFVATGDLDGDGKQEVVLSTGTDVRVYMPAVDLKPLWELKGSAMDNHLWIDLIDFNRNGRDELAVTAIRSGEVVSFIYELSGSEFRKLWEGKYFLRKAGSGMMIQAYSASEGFTGDVMNLDWDGEYKVGAKVKLPKGVNLYDFIPLQGSDGETLVFAYDEKGFLSLYDSKGLRVWMSNTGTGGFLTTFKKQAPATYIEAGEWSVKDRLLPRNKEILVIQRVPLADVAKGMGYKSSRIKSYWWNGFAMEEKVLVDDIRGSVLDQALAGDKLIVLTNPFLGFKFENILKGASPVGTMLYIYSVKGW